MKKIKIVFIASLIFSLLFNCFALADFSPVRTNLLESAKSYAMDNVTEFIASGDAGALWNESTSISTHIELYAPDNTVNGYIFHFKTADVPSGFMQIGVLDTEFYVVNLGFEGEDLLTKMLNQHNNKSTANAAFSTFATNTSEVLPKVYYIGGFNYYLSNSNGEILDLYSSAVIADGLNKLDSNYDTFRNKISAYIDDNRSASRAITTPTTYTVDSYYDAESYLRSTSYYSGYNDHCSPTAATNMVRYYKYGRGYFTSIANSASSVFRWFYENMETNIGGDGTAYDNILPAYRSYFSENSEMDSASSGRITGVTYSSIQSRINADIPVHLSVESYEDDVNHAVNVWGYTSISSGDYLRITDNLDLDDSVSATLINYDSYEYVQYVYYGPN